MLKRLFQEIKEYKKTSLICIFATLGAVFFEILIPFLMSRIIDRGIGEGNIANLLRYGALMLLASAAALGCGLVSGTFGARAASGFAANLRSSMYRKIQSFSFANIDRFSSAGLITRLTTDVSNVQTSYQLMIRLFLRAPSMIIFAGLMSVLISPSLSLIFLFAILFLGMVLIFLMKRALRIFTQVYEKYDELNKRVQENIGGIRVVKAYVQEDEEIRKFKTSTESIFKMFTDAENKMVLIHPLMYFMTYVCTLLLSWFGAKLIVGGRLSTGQLAGLFSYTFNILISLLILSFVAVSMIISGASARRICEVLEEEAKLSSLSNPVRSVKSGEIEFKEVSFSYAKESRKPVLSDISFKIKEGETIGILGGTGSGKSSLVSLIPRLYEVSSGELIVGGIDVRKYELAALRDAVSMVLQKNELFSGSVLDNLRWGDANASLEDCKEACRLACAKEFIEKLPDAYESRIERGGSNLSGGQKQRLCIARALLKKPKIIIFDDSTSAVDTQTDAKIRENLKHAMKNTTKIMIAQRISSIQDADRILVLKEGRISGFDTHENLLAGNRIYAEVYAAQKESGGDFDKAKDEER